MYAISSLDRIWLNMVEFRQVQSTGMILYKLVVAMHDSLLRRFLINTIADRIKKPHQIRCSHIRKSFFPTFSSFITHTYSNTVLHIFIQKDLTENKAPKLLPINKLHIPTI